MLANRDRCAVREGRRRAWLRGALVLLSASIACGDAHESRAGASTAGGGGGADVPTGSGGSGDLAGVAAGAPGAGGAFGHTSAGGPSGSAGSDAAGTGELSPRLLRYHRTDTDREVHFEIDAVDGLEPYPSSLDYLSDWVGRALPKPDGISFDPGETLESFGQEHVWTFGALDEYARLHASDDASGPVSIHVLFLDGRYDSGDDGTVLGLAWAERHIAIFQDAIRAGCSGVLGPLQEDTCELAERSVWAHEIGHVIGLVDNGLLQQAPHRDAAHGRHDASGGCLMYWAYESPALFDVLLSRLDTGEGPDIDFCENCWADLNAVH